MQFKVVGEMSAAPWHEARGNLSKIPLCDLHFFVYQRLIDRPTGVLGGCWSSARRRAFIAASFGFQRAAANSNRGLDHLFLLGFGPGHHQLVAKQLPSPFSILVRGDEDLEFAARAAAVWELSFYFSVISTAIVKPSSCGCAACVRVGSMCSESIELQASKTMLLLVSCRHCSDGLMCSR